MRARVVVASVAVCLAIVGCSSGSDPNGLTVFAAASLKGVLAEAKTDYEAAHPGSALTIATGASSALATQIEQGAPADLFLSADRRNPEALEAMGLIVGPVVDFATNRLTVIVPSDNPAGIRTPADLAGPGVKIIAAGDAVPITTYANRLVAQLSRLPGYPADFGPAYRANVVSKEDDVRSVVAKIELGEGDAAIVYETDATASRTVDTVPLPDGTDRQATYAGVVLEASPRIDAAGAFLDWFAGPEGGAILARFGFVAPV